ncbi:N-acetylmuramoyl-L-alanine amidase [Ureibacillus sp. GCM10028918]|uniref:N-acetylmuramoyl-L-alanine amidase n=1 Tax=Ureibacillus sp. GCM10028918 TaxID=3273429 RepID=UPI003610AF85
MEKGRIGYWFILLLVCLILVPNQSVSASTLSDIPQTYEKEINYLIGKNIVTGYEDGEFKPNKLVTRQEAATMIGKALNLDGAKPRQTVFSDVKADSYASGYIQAAYDKNIINGYEDGTFGPTKNMTRLEMAYLITSAFKLTASSDFSYADMPSSSNAAKAISSVTSAGITNGYEDGTFRPNNSITRLEFAIMLARALNPEYRIEPVKPSEPKPTEPNEPGETTEGQTMYVTVASLNVRSGPGTSYAKVGSLTKGNEITAYEKTGDWVYMTSSKVSGYVHTGYLSSKKPSLTKVIAIDPGHGGHDPGAVGNGLYEKNLTLGVALHLRDYLNNAGIKVVMTRSTDKFIALEDRVTIAENAGADTFVSLHMNAATSSASGTETYYTTSGTASRAESSKALAQFIQGRLVDAIGSKDRGEKTANYKVIYKNPLPSVLVEMGFISNKEEANYINNHQKETAYAIYLGIQDYYKWLGQ